MADNELTNEEVEFQEMMVALAEAGVIKIDEMEDGELGILVVNNPGPEAMVRIYEDWKRANERLV